MSVAANTAAPQVLLDMDDPTFRTKLEGFTLSDHAAELVDKWTNLPENSAYRTEQQPWTLISAALAVADKAQQSPAAALHALRDAYDFGCTLAGDDLDLFLENPLPATKKKVTALDDGKAWWQLLAAVGLMVANHHRITRTKRGWYQATAEKAEDRAWFPIQPTNAEQALVMAIATPAELTKLGIYLPKGAIAPSRTSAVEDLQRSGLS